MNKWLEILTGLIILLISIILVLPGMPLANWGIAALNLLKGGVILIIALIGILFIILGISELKE